jgi:transcriptional regulator with XRE-family HTH domain
MDIDWGKRFTAIRKELGLTQKQFAEKLNVDQGFYSKMEKNKASLTLDKLPLLFDLGVSPSLFFSKDNMIKKYIMSDRVNTVQSSDIALADAINNLSEKIEKQQNLIIQLAGEKRDALRVDRVGDVDAKISSDK